MMKCVQGEHRLVYTNNINIHAKTQEIHDDDVDDMFGSDEDVVEEAPAMEEMPEPEPLDDDDDDDDDIDALFA